MRRRRTGCDVLAELLQVAVEQAGREHLASWERRVLLRLAVDATEHHCAHIVVVCQLSHDRQ